MNKSFLWTPELDEMLTLMYPDTLASEIANFLGMTRASIYNRAHTLGLVKSDSFAAEASRRSTLARSPFTPDIVELLTKRYADTPTLTLSSLTGLPESKIHAYAKRNGLKKSREVIAQMARDRTTADHPSVLHRFPRGHVPANKGVKGYNNPASVPTQFKKGDRPHTWKPIGSYRVDSDGYLACKVSDTGYPPRDWVAVHRLVWIKAHGSIPAQHIVRFRDGMRTTVLEEITVDRIECISRAEHARRNAWHAKLPPDLRKLMGTRIALTRAVNRHTKRLAQEPS